MHKYGEITEYPMGQAGALTFSVCDCRRNGGGTQGPAKLTVEHERGRVLLVGVDVPGWARRNLLEGCKF